MISLSKVRNVFIEGGFRILRVFQYGVKTSDVSGPFGEDSNPLPNTTAIYANTGVKGDPVVIGYINTNQLQKVSPGEKRIFSLFPNGSNSFEIYLRNNGTCEIGGSQFSAVKYEPLDASVRAQDALINAELVKIASAINALAPGSYVPSPVSTNIIASKSNTVKLGL